MKNRFLSLAIPMLMLSLNAGAANSIRLSDHVPSKALNNASLLERLEATTHVPLTIILPLRNQDELEELISRIYDPTDEEHYGKYLSSEDFIERFAPSQEDYDKVVAYAESSGFTVNNRHPNRTLLNVSSPAHAVESAFNLHLHRYALADGRQFYAPNNDPEVPASVATVVSGVVGLDNHNKRHTYHKRAEAVDGSHAGSHSFPSGPQGGFSPSDLVNAYNLSGVSTNGANQAIALFELASYLDSDISTYTQYFGLPTPQLKNVLVDGGSTDGIDAEVTLDIELAIALAPASVIYVYEAPNTDQGVLDTYNRIATDNLAKQVSTSWGSGEDLGNVKFLQAESAAFKQMAAQGQTIYAAAGDSGAYDNYDSNSSKALVVDDPASQPFVTGVGGTRLQVNPDTGAYQSETVWNDGLGQGAGGGGVSKVWPIPTWQKNVSTIYSKNYRNVPDVALNADTNTGYAIYYNGQWQIYGGTSCAAPLWAAFTACVNQGLAAAQKPSLGFVNPTLYSIASGAAYTNDFHDVTAGNNLFYKAHTGYDNATGWGSFNGANLYATLTNTPSNTSPLLHMILKPAVPFAKEAVGTYHIVVSNTGSSVTSSPVTVGITLPKGLSYSSSSGSGWVFDNNTLSFTQSKALQPNSSYPTLVLNVNIAKDAPSTAIPTASVLGGGSTSSLISNLTTTH